MFYSKSVILWDAASPIEPEPPNTGIAQDITDGIKDILGVGDIQQSYYNMLTFDCIKTEAHDASVEVTKYPVQTGFEISDHIIRRNRRLVLQGMMVNAKIPSMISLQGAFIVGGALAGSSLGSVLGSAYSLFETLTSDSVNRVAGTFERLTELMSNGEKLQVSTILGPYYDCVITNIKTIQNKDNSSVLDVIILMEELITVEDYGAAINEDKIAVRTALMNQKDYSQLGALIGAIGIGTIGMMMQ